MQGPLLGRTPQQHIERYWSGDVNNIPNGVPVFMAANGTDDGKSVQLPSTAITANANNGMCVGIASAQGLQYAPIDTIDFGPVYNALIVLQTRSASSVSFASWAAIAVGDVLSVDSNNNGLARSSSGGQYPYAPQFQALQAFASGTTQASNFSATYTYSTSPSGGLGNTGVATGTISTTPKGLVATGKVFVRCM